MAKPRLPGISPDPHTNVILTDIALRGISRFSRKFAEKRLLGAQLDGKEIKDLIDNPSLSQTLAAIALSRIATRSVPGAVIVSGGLIAKTLWDRSKKRAGIRRKEKREQLLNRSREQQADG